MNCSFHLVQRIQELKSKFVNQFFVRFRPSENKGKQELRIVSMTVQRGKAASMTSVVEYILGIQNEGDFLLKVTRFNGPNFCHV